MAHKVTRRDFVKTSAAVGAAWWISPGVSLAKEKSALEQVNFASIGVAGKGSSDSRDAFVRGNLVAICDVDENHLDKAAVSFPKAQKFTDYREMLDKLEGEIDAVTVSTPDHSHAPAALMAMRKKMHCFCQKPLTYTIEEARMMRQVASEMGVATQMGNQGTAPDGFREGVEIVRSGALGTVTDVHVWTNRPRWYGGKGRPAETSPVPENLHWDLWLGPAPERPYVAGDVYHPFHWRGWLDFGTGALGDMGCHTANLAVMALELYDPTTIEVIESAGIIENETYPTYTVIAYHFPERNGRPPVKFTWYDGGRLPSNELFQGKTPSDSGLMIVGDKGTFYSPNDYGAEHVLLPEDKFADYKKPEPSLPRSPGHFEEFVRACKGGEPAMSNFDYAGRLTETILLGNVALRAGQTVEWDAENMKVKNIPDSDHLIRRQYRDGFSIHV